MWSTQNDCDYVLAFINFYSLLDHQIVIDVCVMAFIFVLNNLVSSLSLHLRFFVGSLVEVNHCYHWYIVLEGLVFYYRMGEISVLMTMLGLVCFGRSQQTSLGWEKVSVENFLKNPDTVCVKVCVRGEVRAPRVILKSLKEYENLIAGTIVCSPF